VTQIGEAVDVGFLSASDGECPFDHDSAEPPNVKNDFIGDAPALERNAENQVGTHLYDKRKPEKPPDKLICPNYDPKHVFFDDRKEDDYPVVIPWEDEKTKENGFHRYPVTCAPHHLIPAQESLKRAETLLKYMIKKGAPEKVNDGTRKGICYADVGYDVNGSQNCMFLPGSYGVSSIGTGQWTSAPSALGDPGFEEDGHNDKENVAKPKKCSSPKLTGDRHQVHPDNRKWLYVKQAVKLAPGQFHDRHPDYSDVVLTVLEKIGEEYDQRYRDIFQKDVGCPKCKERFKKMEEAGVPTPFALVDRLNGVSARFAGYLNGGTWNIKLYTSKWGLAYMRAIKNGSPDT
jgi:hypothetical protein